MTKHFDDDHGEGYAAGEEWKPCPFCGELPHHPVWDVNAIYPSCDCYAVSFEDGPTMPDKWQQRPLEDALRAERDQLRRERDEAREALKKITNTGLRFTASGHRECDKIARDALSTPSTDGGEH